MNPELLFSICSFLVLPAWLLLAGAPRWKWTGRMVPATIVLLAVVYLVLVVAHLPGAEGGFASLAAVGTLFRNPNALLAGWIHYLAFDLFVGAWETRDARRFGVPQLAVVPCLVMTFLLGPIGLFMYMVLRAVLRRRFVLEEADARA